MITELVMQMLYKLLRKFLELLLIVFVVTECTSMLQSEKSLNDAIIVPSDEQTSSVSKIVNTENKNLQDVTQTSSVGNNDPSEENEKVKNIVKKDKKSTV